MKLKGGKKEKKDDFLGVNELSPDEKRIAVLRKKKEVLTEVEQIFFNKMFNAYESQYKTKSPLNHAMCVSLRKKLLRMHLLKEVEIL